MTTINLMNSLFNRLSIAGYDRQYLYNTVLPSWWNDDLATEGSAYSEAILIIGKRLGLDIASLQDESVPVKPVVTLGRFWKRSQDDEADLDSAARIAERASRIALSALPKQRRVLGDSVIAVREAIQGQRNRVITLDLILQYCWDCGIPVLHVSRYPRDVKKMVGVAFSIDNKPAIVLSHNLTFRARQMFFLAHELGHLVLKHLDGDGVILPKSAQLDDFSENDEESQANDFAMRLITGSGDNESYFADLAYNPTVRSLPGTVRTRGRNYRINPGFLAVRYGREAKRAGLNRWPVVQSALGSIDKTDAISLINVTMWKRLQSESLAEDSLEFLQRVTNTAA